MALTTDDMKWLDGRFTAVYTKIDGVAQAVRAEEHTCRQEVDARLDAQAGCAAKLKERTTRLEERLKWTVGTVSSIIAFAVSILTAVLIYFFTGG